jgi:hypothetical protein
MPVRSVESSPGHRVFEFRCDTCGAYACAGEDCHITEALRTGDVSPAGRWFCGMDANRNPACVDKGRAAA